ncbi:hypothetical protein JCM17207_17750 [Faecalibacterium gallinarum]|uniref:Uncharacterized protein n=1 Tax=Faecalibacterium gallinarum TaxID=2903556 RepID=A0AA37IZI8_9FIRM|nr:hypothetical protein JCM17207_17750 [Faecalibacterium gallinarum]
MDFLLPTLPSDEEIIPFACGNNDPCKGCRGGCKGCDAGCEGCTGGLLFG